MQSLRFSVRNISHTQFGREKTERHVGRKKIRQIMFSVSTHRENQREQDVWKTLHVSVENIHRRSQARIGLSHHSSACPHTHRIRSNQREQDVRKILHVSVENIHTRSQARIGLSHLYSACPHTHRIRSENIHTNTVGPEKTEPHTAREKKIPHNIVQRVHTHTHTHTQRQVTEEEIPTDIQRNHSGTKACPALQSFRVAAGYSRTNEIPINLSEGENPPSTRWSSQPAATV